jgi:cytochrome b6-f complex iron-sulfur subunit
MTDLKEALQEYSKFAGKKTKFGSRRAFLQLGLAAMGAAWVGTWIQTRLFPSDTNEEAKPVRIALNELPVGGTKQINYGGTQVLVLRTQESVRAFSMVCTHLGCLVEWQPTEEGFYCPCHDGRFDQFGEVTAGPPPVPLEQFPATIEGDQVIVGEIF